MDKVDRFGNTINLWDTVIYSGSGRGLIVGIVVKLNPKSYKIKEFKRFVHSGGEYFNYHDVPFTRKHSLIRSESINAIDPADFLSDVEQRRMREDT